MSNNFMAYENDKCIFFALGRNAMYAACQMLAIKRGDEILTPAYDCDTALQPFIVLGYKLKFFHLDPYTFNVDIDDIKKKVTSKTKLIHIINYFGMLQQWDKLLLLRKETGIPILEDNAYSLFSTLNNKPCGSFGDMSIFSLRKNLPLIDGGMLRINNNFGYAFKYANKKSPWFYPVDTQSLLYIAKNKLGFHKLPGIASYLLRKIGIAPRETPPPLYSEKENGYPDWILRDRIGKDFSCDYLRPMSRLAERQLKKISQNDYNDICIQKRKFYILLSKEISDIKRIKIIHPVLPEGIVPFCLSFLVDINRDIFLETLRKKYDVMAWPMLSQEVINQLEHFPDVELLCRKLLQVNLRADMVILPGFDEYLKKFVLDFKEISKRYLN